MTDTVIVHVRERDEWLDRRQKHARSASLGHEVRVARGAYVAAESWTELTPHDQYLVRVRAVAESRRRAGLVLSHWSAAALHGLPHLGSWQHRVHAIVGRTSGGRSDAAVFKHSMELSDEDVTYVNGLPVTTVARTVLDIATTCEYLMAIMVADRSLLVDRFHRVDPLATRDELVAAWERAMPFRGFQRARLAIDFAVTDSESPLESVSRANMRIIGCAPPQLQREFRDRAGLIGRVDFYWPESGLVGEADGHAKYLSPIVRGNKSADQIVLDEKIREDRIRATGKRVTRWGWSVGVDAAALKSHLSRAGVLTISR